jgi:hypothetical protein
MTKLPMISFKLWFFHKVGKSGKPQNRSKRSSFYQRPNFSQTIIRQVPTDITYPVIILTVVNFPNLTHLPPRTGGNAK